MKKILILAAILLLVVALSGCAQTGEAWWKTPKIPKPQPIDPHKIMCQQYSAMCAQGYQYYCVLHMQQCAIAEVPCDGDIQDTLATGQTQTYTISGKDYEASIHYLSAGACKFKVNGEVTDLLKAGDKDTLADGTILKIQSVQSNSVTFCMEHVQAYEKVGAVILVNDVGPASDVVLAARIASVINQRQQIDVNTITKLDSGVKVDDLEKYDLVVRILQGDVNLFVAENAPSTAVLMVADIKIDLQQVNVVANEKMMPQMNVRDLCEIKPSTSQNTIEVAIAPAGRDWDGTLNMEGKSFVLIYYPSANLLKIFHPNNVISDVAIDKNYMGTWNYQGKTYQVKIDLNRRVIYFIF